MEITIRNLDHEVHRLLANRAIANGRSVEAEACAILVAAVEPPNFARDWLAMAEPLSVELELPERSMPREIDLS